MNFLLVFLLFSSTWAYPKFSENTPICRREVLFQWEQLDFAFNSEDMRRDFIERGEFIQKNCIISGIKVFKDRIFLTVPRWRKGIPATLNYIKLNGSDPGILDISPQSQIPVNNSSNSTTRPEILISNDLDPMSPILIPYPTWQMQKEGNCTELQFVHAIEVDEYQRLWVADLGRVNMFEGKGKLQGNCSAKLVIFDLKTDTVLRRFDLPDEFVSRNSNFMHSMSVSCQSEDECWAYIADSQDTKIIVYNYKEGTSWFVQHYTMRGDIQNEKSFNILGKGYPFDANIHGMVISPKTQANESIYFTSLNGKELYSVKTASIQKIFRVINATLNESDVQLIGKKRGMSDGIAIDSRGRLFLTDIEEHSIRMWDTEQGMGKMHSGNQILLDSDEYEMEWPDSLSLDENEQFLYATVNKLQGYFLKTLDVNDVNFRILRIWLPEG